ncbi:aldehyde dehydrogenase family protein [Klebsiella pneumoniae]|nr:aldehyde dehydrogenase family protein [Klebsiella pneumoniae]
MLRYKPHGVMVIFGPYNFPGHLPSGHIIPALIARNIIMFKPSELTPATTEMTRSGTASSRPSIPGGAINLLRGGKASGQALLENRLIPAACCSPAARRPVSTSISYFGGQPERKMLALEMGGNNALIVRRH